MILQAMGKKYSSSVYLQLIMYLVIDIHEAEMLVPPMSQQNQLLSHVRCHCSICSFQNHRYAYNETIKSGLFTSLVRDSASI